MSHWSKVESTITDAGILQSACEELGAEVLLNAVARGFSRDSSVSSYGKDKLSDIVIRIPNCKYDLSVTKNAQGVYEIEGEWWGGELERFFGKEGHKVGKILEMYGVHKAEALCRKKRKKFNRVVRGTHVDIEVFA